MCVARTARRRRMQALKKYRHLPPLRRPRYSKISEGKSANRMRKMLEKQKQMQGRKGRKG